MKCVATCFGLYKTCKVVNEMCSNMFRLCKVETCCCVKEYRSVIVSMLVFIISFIILRHNAMYSFKICKVREL